MKTYKGVEKIRRAVKRLKPGRGVALRYRALFKPTAAALEESRMAKRQGLDLQTYTGPVDRVWVTAARKLVLTVLCKERVNPREERFCYRTFRLEGIRALTA